MSSEKKKFWIHMKILSNSLIVYHIKVVTKNSFGIRTMYFY